MPHDPHTPDADKSEETAVHLFTVEDAASGVRLDRYLADKLHGDGLSREKIKALIKDGQVLLDGKPAALPRQALSPGETVRVCLPESHSVLEAEDGDIRVLYRDAALAVIDKAAGLTVHPAPGLPSGTLAHRLLAHFPELALQEGPRPGIVHRLDKDTSGLMLVALSERCRLALAGQFAAHEVFKEYLAIIHGVPKSASGVIEAPIGRHPTQKTRMAVLPQGKSAKSAWRLLHADPAGRFALVAVRIFSGRTHQVRVHMLHIGHPLWGDSLYRLPGAPSPTREGLAARQMLHAWRLSFTHPEPEYISELPEGARRDGDRLSFVCPPPDDFFACLSRLSRRMLRVVITGSPGCGKSTLSALLRESGLAVFSADADVAAEYAPGRDGHRLLRSAFGERFVPGPDAPVDKAALGKAMREDAGVRRQVEALLHPLVRHNLEVFWREQEAAGAALAAAEIPLYLEAGALFQTAPGEPRPVLVGVSCPFAIREERLLETRHWPPEVIAAMESWQWPEEAKMRACDYVVDNSDDLAAFTREGEALLAALHALKDKRDAESLERIAATIDAAPPSPGTPEW